MRRECSHSLTCATSKVNRDAGSTEAHCPNRFPQVGRSALEIVRRYGEAIGAFDARRRCPFQCNFCTIINVQGRKSRWRDADDVERLVRANLGQGVFRFFITDDNFARNRNWEAIFDRLIEMRERDGLDLQFIIQVDTLCHRIPNCVEKAARAGCKRVFIGSKHQPRQPAVRPRAEPGARIPPDVSRLARPAGHYLCRLHPRFSGDTPERIARDIRTVQQDAGRPALKFYPDTITRLGRPPAAVHNTGYGWTPT